MDNKRKLFRTLLLSGVLLSIKALNADYLIDENKLEEKTTKAIEWNEISSIDYENVIENYFRSRNSKISEVEKTSNYNNLESNENYFIILINQFSEKIDLKDKNNDRKDHNIKGTRSVEINYKRKRSVDSTVPNLNKTMTNETNSTTEACVGAEEYCNMTREDYVEMLNNYIYPHTFEWVLIATYTLVFIGGLVGNALVCIAVYRNHSMRTVTNYFIVNLAVADFMVILLCLPPTLLWDVTETWFFGTALCKIILYLQSVSVTVSVLTLTFISVDRWYAICFPLKFKSTTSRAKVAIFVIWAVSLTLNGPELVVLTTEQTVPLRFELQYLIQCVASWSQQSDLVWHIIKIVFIYTVPLMLMTLAHYHIVKVLWRSEKIPGQADTAKLAPAERCQLRSRRKAAKMLAAVVIMFAVCYFPVHLLSMLRPRGVAYPQCTERASGEHTLSGWLRTVLPIAAALRRSRRSLRLHSLWNFSSITNARWQRCYNFPVHFLSMLRYSQDMAQTDVVTFLALISHVLCYANSAINPLIYNFMSGKFRREFRRAFCCSVDPVREHSTALTRITTVKKPYELVAFDNRESRQSCVRNTTLF